MNPAHGTLHQPPPAGIDGVLARVKQLGASVLDHVALRGELLSLEWQDELARLSTLAMVLLLAVALAVISIVFTGVAVLVMFWDTPYRLTAAVLLAMTFAGGALLSAWATWQQLRQPTHLLRDSIAELRSDATQLRTTAAL